MDDNEWNDESQNDESRHENERHYQRRLTSVEKFITRLNLKMTYRNQARLQSGGTEHGISEKWHHLNYELYKSGIQMAFK